MPSATEDLLIRIDATTEQLRRELRRADEVVNGSSRNINRRLGWADAAFTR
ncbi:hypothetical protein [Nitrococcus mobilis]|uniref:Uncharacterized protein n=1 Tax=Nitrococcus mobilis Nb-231 TaxID=314278 RepID=A4BKZ2_9GAMM|nr:hypothetical protein [Nitrococcus mobilis]EAR22980.1 hypothetical protein NB231_14208 [Nitrococcus mobilis Nb-231]